MQNRYAGDLGDYAKCGLLRALCAADLRLGMVWYLTDDESHNNDGKHRPKLAMRACDQKLFAAFQNIGSQRSVAALERIDAWPANTAFFSEPLRWTSNSAKQRATFRSGWGRRAVQATTGCDVVCVDPDNGLEVASVKRTAKLGPKYAFIDELQPFWQNGQSLVIYQHTNRQGTACEQAARRLGQLSEHWAKRATLRAVQFRRGSNRLFLIAMQPAHRERLNDRLDALLAGPWAGHFQACP